MLTFKTRNDLIDTLPKGMVVAELGVFTANFSNEIIQRLQPKLFYMVDIWQGSMTSGDKDGNNIITIDNMEDVYKIIIEQTNEMSGVQIIKSDSSEFLSKHLNNEFDFIYIDADHTYTAVRNDLSLAFQKLKNGAYLSGHDYIDGNEVKTAVDDFCNEKNQEILGITQDGCPSFLIKVKK